MEDAPVALRALTLTGYRNVQHIFDCLAVVEELLLHGPFGVVVDVDGTIAPIAPSPELAKVTTACRRELRTLSRVVPLVAAISGRPVREARDMVGVSSMTYLGNHGLERWERGKVVVDPEVAAFLEPIKKALCYLSANIGEPGVRIEDKEITLSVHYRQAANSETARQIVLAAATRIAELEGLRVTDGRMVVEVRPPVDMGKGTAVMRLIEAHNLRSAVYLGDDVTDIDAFTTLRDWRNGGRGRSISIAVLSTESKELLIEAADAYANGVYDVERFLAWLSSLASKLASRDPRAGGKAT